MPKITINGIYLDPEAEMRNLSLAGFNIESQNRANSNYILIQTTQPLTRTQKEDLANLKVDILEYVPESTYLCCYTSHDLEPIRQLSYVSYVTEYLKGFKINPELRNSSGEGSSQNLLELSPIEPSLSHERKHVEVVFHQNVSPEDIRVRLAEAAGIAPDNLEISGNTASFYVEPARLEDLAQLDEVHHIEEYPEATLFNNVASKIIKADQTHLECKLEGEGEIVAVCDTGFDKGSTEDVHPAFTSRVFKLYSLGRTEKQNADDPDGHGTHVAGTLLGDGKSETMGGLIRGIAPKAQLIMQSAYFSVSERLGGLPPNLNTLFEQPYEDGARIHNNSWGDDDDEHAAKYTAYSQQVDAFVWEHRDMVICFCAGNEGTDHSKNGVVDLGSLTPPGTAKNCITVGASESDRPEWAPEKTYGQIQRSRYPKDPIHSNYMARNPEGIAPFSGRGPAADGQKGRYKPDVVAPGSCILSTQSRIAKPESIRGRSKAPSEDPLYSFDTGTSMATPQVAGCAAVVREYFREKRTHPNPSAALVKAMLINGAQRLSGQDTPSEVSDWPDFSQGFGRVDLAATVGPYGENEKVDFKDEETELNTEEEEPIEVSIDSKDTTLKVTLVWTDPSGEALQNDLDLIVRAGGQERRGNMHPSSTEFDRQNNVEQVVWENVPVGQAVILVRAYRVTKYPQSYALVWRVQSSPLNTQAN